MRFIINAVAILAVALPAAVQAQQPAPPDASEAPPVCQASMQGSQLTTVVKFQDGYTVEGPWQVDHRQAKAMDDGAQGIEIGATLDRIVEVQPSTGARQATPFPKPLQITFDGHNQRELVSRAAQIWCLSVMAARREAGPTFGHVAPPVGVHTTR